MRTGRRTLLWPESVRGLSVAKATPEGRVKAKCKTILKERGIWYYMPVQNGMGVVGIPDLICCWDGKFLAIETKAPGKIRALTANQKLQIRKIKEASGYALVIDNPDTLEAWLDGTEREIEEQEPST